MTYSFDPYGSSRPRRSWWSENRSAALLIGGVLLFFLLCFGGCAAYRSTAKDVTFKVSDKAVVATSDSNGHKYMIYTTHGNVFQDTDSVAFWKFDSSNVYAKLLVGHTYTCEVTGWRIPILSAQNNIIECSEVSASTHLTA